MGKRIFISFGLPEDDQGFAPCEKTIIQNMICTIGKYACAHDHTVVIRYHPAIIDLMQALFEDHPEQLVIAPEQAAFDDFAAQHKPDLALFIGGADVSMQDAQDIARYPNIKALALPVTGGAAKTIHDRIDPAGHALSDTDNFTALYRALDSLTPPQHPSSPQPPTTKPPSP